MSRRAVVLVDGEHYPPVTIEAIEHLRTRGDDVVAAVMLGGIEKLKGALELGGTPIVAADGQLAALREAIARYAPEVVLDVSDAPVLDAAKRAALACEALAAGVHYEGADFTFAPPPRPSLIGVPTIAVIGTGKRTGKTAVAAALARCATDRGLRVVMVAMGRGGPAEPVVTRGDLDPPTVDALLALAAAGEHAATDAYEDAVVARVATVGARRAGAGMTGATVVDTVAAAVEVAATLEPDLVLLEGSGTAIPPCHADATVLVVGGATRPWEISDGLGPVKLLISDLAVVTMVEEPVLETGTLSALPSTLDRFARSVPIIETVFRPTPLEPVQGVQVFVATTAPEAVGPRLRAHLEQQHGATVAGITHRLADRSRLIQDLREAEGTYEVLLTEIKAAGIDVAARAAVDAGARVVFFDNTPVSTRGDLQAAFASILETVAGGGSAS